MMGRGPGGHGGRPGGGHGMGMAMGMPTERSRDFRGSVRRLLGHLAPERPRLLLVLALAAASVLFTVLGPRILGEAIDVIVAGVFLPGSSGIDMGALGDVLVRLTGVYVLASLLMWAQIWIMAGVTQRTVYRLREQVAAKLGRLPLRAFDDRPRGELLSRVTNDIDNIGQVLQQTLTQLITALLTIVGVLAMMIVISPLLALVSLLAVPVSMVVTLLIARRSQPWFRAQWASTGTLNAHIEEMHTGHTVVQVFGHQAEAIATFDIENERLYEAGYRAQFISGIIQPALTIISNLNYVAIAVVGGLQVTAGAISLGDVVASSTTRASSRSPSSRPRASPPCSRAPWRPRRGVRGAGRGRGGEPTRSLRPGWRGAGCHRHRGRLVRYKPDVPLITDLSLECYPVLPWPSWAPRAPARRRWSTC